MAEIVTPKFTAAQFISSATKTLTAGEIVKIGEYVVPAGEEISIGSGMLAGFDNATGRIFCKFMDNQGTPAEITGTVRFEQYSPQNRPIEILREFRTEDLNTNETDFTKQTPFPEHDVWITKDQKIVINFIADTGSPVLSKANSKMLVPMTRKLV